MTDNIDDLLDQFVLEFKQRLRDPGEWEQVLFIDYCWKWFNTYKKSRAYNTQVMYEHIIRRHFTVYFDGLVFSDLSLSFVQGLINLHLENPRTCELIALTLKQILNSAVRDGLYPMSAVNTIFDGLALPKRNKLQKRTLTDIERKTVLNCRLDSSMKDCFLAILYYTGIRRGEALALCPDDFDFVSGSVSISKTLIFTGFSDSEIKDCPKSDRGFRSIPLPADCINRIRSYIDSCSGYIFHGQGAVLANRSFYRRFWESIVSELNIKAGYNPWKKKQKDPKPIKDLTAHIFRHDFCSSLCYQVPEISTKMIAYLLGDSEKMVLEVYSHILLDKEKVLSSISAARTIPEVSHVGIEPTTT